MLDFYNLDNITISVIVISAIVIYKLLEFKKEMEGKTVYKIIISLFLGIVLSFGVSYFMVENDTILTSNFWE